MKDKRLSIRISKPVNEVFAFTITPMNTKLWVDSVKVEETNEWPIHIGSKYRNQNKTTGEWNEYTVTDYKEYKVFELASKDKNYHVRYTYNSIDQETSEFEYYEWVDKGELEDPFTQEILEKLKSVVES